MEGAEPSPSPEHPAFPSCVGTVGSRGHRSVRATLRAGCIHLRRWVLAALGGLALGTGLKMVLLFTAAQLLPFVAAILAAGATLFASTDPIYTRAALGTLADFRIEGIAVAGVAGDTLHALAPDLFVASGRASGRLVRLATEPGSAVLGRLVAYFLAHAGVLTAGLLLLRAGIVRQRATLAIMGVAAQLEVVASLLRRQPTIDELESTGLSFAVNVLLPWLSGRRVALSDLVVHLPGAVVGAGLVALALLLAYAGAAVLALLVVWLIRLSKRLAGRGPDGRVRWLPSRRGAGAYATTAGALVLVSVVLAFASEPSGTTVRPVSEAAPVVGAADLPSGTEANQTIKSAIVPLLVEEPGAPEPSAPAVTSTLPRPLPSKVEVRGARYDYTYLVNGTPQVIRGMGLNTQYTRLLTPAKRVKRLHADFAMLRSMGFNTVLGWEEEEFDETLLDVAYRHDLGVVLPLELDAAADYTDPAVRTALLERVTAWVERYRHHPALRMWGLGNEVLHKIVHPAWVGPQDPQRDRNAQAFADWLLEAADAIHALDPDHPVTYRSAEDAFTPWVAAALQRRGGGHRSWFVWGTNCYQDYLQELIERWPERGIDAALWASEFAPGGMAVPDRPAGFQKMWSYVQHHRNRVLGGAVYAWTRNGPEEIDRTFGLTDDGTPVDGHSLEALAGLFRGMREGRGESIAR